MQEMHETWVQPLGLEDPLEESMAPLQYAWCAMIHRVTKSQTLLKQLSTHALTLMYLSFFEVNFSYNQHYKVYDSVAFSVFPMLCNYYLSQFC